MCCTGLIFITLDPLNWCSGHCLLLNLKDNFQISVQLNHSPNESIWQSWRCSLISSPFSDYQWYTPQIKWWEILPSGAVTKLGRIVIFPMCFISQIKECNSDKIYSSLGSRMWQAFYSFHHRPPPVSPAQPVAAFLDVAWSSEIPQYLSILLYLCHHADQTEEK